MYSARVVVLVMAPKSSDAPSVPRENVLITIREAALLQGFPKGYKFSVKYGKVVLARMIGNALPPPFIAAHARAIGAALRPPGC